mmetsp:Transcript_58743/g.132957  ORF Transcript_58743/g.132957 Transcript_58743/m.132957 type:complete len:130 (+) Transcript_58743:94-483(+)
MCPWHDPLALTTPWGISRRRYPPGKSPGHQPRAAAHSPCGPPEPPPPETPETPPAPPPEADKEAEAAAEGAGDKKAGPVLGAGVSTGGWGGEAAKSRLARRIDANTCSGSSAAPSPCKTRAKSTVSVLA